ncbi:MAG: hypothetical protein IJP03_00150, partial [Christensenellaceae bacterium]|nr:hypothetical protein [Christensenellaceae bacterium]
MTKENKKRYYATTRPYNRVPHPHLSFKVGKWLVKSAFPKHKVVFEQPPEADEQAIFVANHAKAYGPLVMMLRFPVKARPWVISNVCFSRTFPAFAMQDFWHPKNKFTRALYWVLSYALVPVARWVFLGIEAIPAYFDRNSHITVKKSVQTLKEDLSIVLFPENRTPYSEYNEDFSSGFIFVARRYYKETGKKLKFYPVYACPKNRVIHVGRPVQYDPAQDFRTHQEDIKNYLRDDMTRIARQLGAPPTYEK